MLQLGEKKQKTTPILRNRVGATVERECSSCPVLALHYTAQMKKVLKTRQNKRSSKNPSQWAERKRTWGEDESSECSPPCRNLGGLRTTQKAFRHVFRPWPASVLSAEASERCHWCLNLGISLTLCYVFILLKGAKSIQTIVNGSLGKKQMKSAWPT